MKKLFSLLITLLFLLSLTACGEPKGVTITNELGVDLITVSVLDENEEGMILPSGIEAGGTDIVYLALGSGGYVTVDAEDAAHNTYHFSVYLRDGVDMRLWNDYAGNVWAEYPYNDDAQQYEGVYTSADPSLELRGEWHYSSGSDTLTLDGTDAYIWQSEEGIERGSYTFDGEWIEFTPTSEFIIGWTRGTLNAEGKLCIEGDAGSYFTRAD